MGTGGAGAYYAEIGSLGTQVDGDDTSCDVGDQGRNHEGRDAAWASLKKDGHRCLDRLHATDAGTNQPAGTLRL